ncbi:hypothetical protein NZK33_04755 [Cyanobium sp. FGCU-6]|nr:hypothetical protein [Cyanobium sp. FGCU6]
MSGSFTLLPGEEIYLQSPKVPLLLTNFRVCHHYKVYPDQQFDSITLEAIGSMGLRTVSWPRLLIIAAVLFLISIAVAQQPYGAGNNAAGFLALIGVLLVLIYFLTRKRKIVIESNGGWKMHVPANKLSLDECYFMIHAVDRAKLEFLHKVPEQP